MANSFVDPRRYGDYTDYGPYIMWSNSPRGGRGETEQEYMLRQMYPDLFANQGEDATSARRAYLQASLNAPRADDTLENERETVVDETGDTGIPTVVQPEVDSEGIQGGGNRTLVSQGTGPGQDRYNLPINQVTAQAQPAATGGWGGEVDKSPTPSGGVSRDVDPYGGWGGEVGGVGVPSSDRKPTTTTTPGTGSPGTRDATAISEVNEVGGGAGDQGDPSGAGQGLMYPRTPGTLPSFQPPKAAARLQPPADRVALYQQLRPYPGLSRSEKMSNMIASAFRSAGKPGTGNIFKDSANAYAEGVETYQKLVDYDRAMKSQYADKVLGQLSAQEEARRKGIETGSKVSKEYSESQRALAYAFYLANRGLYYTNFRGPAELKDADTKRILADLDKWELEHKTTFVGPGGVSYQRDKDGNVINIVRNEQQFAQNEGQLKMQRAQWLVKAMAEIKGTLSPEEIHEIYMEAMWGYPPAQRARGTALAQVQDIYDKFPPGPQRDAELDKLKEQGQHAQGVTPQRELRYGPDPSLAPNTVKSLASTIIDEHTDPATGKFDLEAATKAVYARHPNGSYVIPRGNIRIQDLLDEFKKAATAQVPPRQSGPPAGYQGAGGGTGKPGVKVDPKTKSTLDKMKKLQKGVTGSGGGGGVTPGRTY